MRMRAAVIFLAAGLFAGGCTSHSPADRSAAMPTRGVTAVACSVSKIRRTVGSFFRAWDSHRADSLSGLFATNGELDFSTMTQNARRNGSNGYAVATSRSQIAAFAERQWRLGERIAYRGMAVYAGMTPDGTGAEVRRVRATFANGRSQHFIEAKFHVDCSQDLIPHAVLVSASAAR